MDADTRRGGEVVRLDGAVSGALQHCADTKVLVPAIGEAPAELDPGVAALAGAGTRLVKADEPQVHAPVASAEGRQTGRGELSVQQVGQQYLQRHGFARAVVSAQQQPTVVEREDLLVVEEEVENSRAQRLPSAPDRFG